MMLGWKASTVCGFTDGRGRTGPAALFIIVIIIIVTILSCYLSLLLGHPPPQRLVSRSGKAISEIV